MRKIVKILLLCIGVLIIVLPVYFFADQLGYIRKKQIVIMTDEGFKPARLTIKKNTRVVFRNNGKDEHWPASDFHPTHGIYPEFDPLEGILPGREWNFVFKKIGKWRMHDHLAPEFRGVIVVNP